MKQWWLLSFLIIGLSGGIEAQEQSDSSYWQAYVIGDAGLSVGIPAGPFRRNVDRGLVGFQASALINFQKSPGIFGGISISNYRFYNTSGVYPLAIDGITEDYDVYSWVSLMNLHWTFRVMPPWRLRLTPYVEASIGTKRLAVKSEAYFIGEDRNEVDPLESYFQAQDWALSYGGALGAYYRLTTWENNDLLLHLSIHYYPGTALDYYVLGPDNLPPTYNPIDAYESKFSTSDLWQVNIGLTFALGSNFAVE